MNDFVISKKMVMNITHHDFELKFYNEKVDIKSLNLKI